MLFSPKYRERFKKSCVDYDIYANERNRIMAMGISEFHDEFFPEMDHDECYWYHYLIRLTEFESGGLQRVKDAHA